MTNQVHIKLRIITDYTGNDSKFGIANDVEYTRGEFLAVFDAAQRKALRKGAEVVMETMHTNHTFFAI